MRLALLTIALLASSLLARAQDGGDSTSVQMVLVQCVTKAAGKYATIDAPMAEVIEVAFAVCNGERFRFDQEVGPGETRDLLYAELRRQLLKQIADARL